MAHTKPEQLADLESELAEISLLPGLKEKSRGIFYYKSVPFLHFHDAEEERCADIKLDGTWSRISLPAPAKKTESEKFLRAVKSAHKKLAVPAKKIKT
ncbi:MAG: hypothetical protein ACXWQO_15205 [Bdellovibrionota bacterium]